MIKMFLPSYSLLLLQLLILQLYCSSVNGGPGPSPINSGSGKWWLQWEENEDPSLAADEVNITTAEGRTASLPCRVMNLHDKRISWIRARDLTVLAVDRTTVTSDARFSVKHPEETGDWILEIRGALLSDSGTYDCQVNTYPKKSTRVNLRVLSLEDAEAFLQIPASDSIMTVKKKLAAVSEASPQPQYPTSKESQQTSGSVEAIKLRIPGQGHAEVAVGRAIGLSCEASGHDLKAAYYSSRSPDTPLIVWTLDEVPVAMLFPKHKIEMYENWQKDQTKVLSHLTIFDLTIEDSGTYSCNAPHAARKSIPVTVVVNSDAYSKKIYSRHSQLRPRPPTADGQTNFEQMDAPPQPPFPQSAIAGSSFRPMTSCSSHKTVIISWALLFLITLINCAVCVTLYCKAH